MRRVRGDDDAVVRFAVGDAAHVEHGGDGVEFVDADAQAHDAECGRAFQRVGAGVFLDFGARLNVDRRVVELLFRTGL